MLAGCFCYEFVLLQVTPVIGQRFSGCGGLPETRLGDMAGYVDGGGWSFVQFLKVLQ
jgi:hypothetical protein